MSAMDGPFGHDGDVVCMSLNKVCKLLHKSLVFLEVSNGWVTGKPFEALPVCLEGLGYVRVSADDEGKRLQRPHAGGKSTREFR